MSRIVREGKARCTREPRCDFGLEGFDEGKTYRFQLMERANGTRYLRLWHPADEDDPSYCPESYDVCRPAALARFFEVVDDCCAEQRTTA